MNQKYATLFGIGLSAALFIGCEDMKKQTRDAVPVADSVLTEVIVPETEQVLIIPPLMPEDIILTKEFLYDKYTLEDIEMMTEISRKTLIKLEKGGDVRFSTLTTVLSILGLTLDFSDQTKALLQDQSENIDDDWY